MGKNGMEIYGKDQLKSVKCIVLNFNWNFISLQPIQTIYWLWRERRGGC